MKAPKSLGNMVAQRSFKSIFKMDDERQKNTGKNLIDLLNGREQIKGTFRTELFIIGVFQLILVGIDEVIVAVLHKHRFNICFLPIWNNDIMIRQFSNLLAICFEWFICFQLSYPTEKGVTRRSRLFLSTFRQRTNCRKTRYYRVTKVYIELKSLSTNSSRREDPNLITNVNSFIFKSGLGEWFDFVFLNIKIARCFGGR